MTTDMDFVSSVTNPTGNVAIVDSLRDYVISNSGRCYYYDINSHCTANSFYIFAYRNGEVNTSDGNYYCIADTPSSCIKKK